jgi:hypothetical protein
MQEILTKEFAAQVRKNITDESPAMFYFVRALTLADRIPHIPPIITTPNMIHQLTMELYVLVLILELIFKSIFPDPRIRRSKGRHGSVCDVLSKLDFRLASS